MNTRIQELAAQAGWGPTHDPYTRQAFNVSLFAKLIAKECSYVCRAVGEAVWAEQHQSNIGTARTCEAAIMEHFGVKE